MTAEQSLLAVLLVPLASAAIICFFLRRQGVLASYLSVAAAAGICLFSFLAFQASNGGDVAVSKEWLSLGNFTVSLGFLFDGTAKTMLAMVAFVGFLIHLFSLGYMKEDKARARFFGGCPFSCSRCSASCWPTI